MSYINHLGMVTKNWLYLYLYQFYYIRSRTRVARTVGRKKKKENKKKKRGAGTFLCGRTRDVNCWLAAAASAAIAGIATTKSNVATHIGKRKFASLPCAQPASIECWLMKLKHCQGIILWSKGWTLDNPLTILNWRSRDSCHTTKDMGWVDNQVDPVCYL